MKKFVYTTEEDVKHTSNLIGILSSHGIENIYLQKLTSEQVIQKFNQGKMDGIDPENKLFKTTTVFYNFFINNKEFVMQVTQQELILFVSSLEDKDT